MDKESKTLLILLILIILGSIAFTFYKTLIKGDIDYTETDESGEKITEMLNAE